MFVFNYILMFVLVMGSNEQKTYIKEYYANGILKSEGWSINNQKTDYWFYYFENGNVKGKGSYETNKKNGYWFFYNQSNAVISQGHYQNGKRVDWWVLLIEKNVVEKVQFVNDVRQGYSLLYKNGNLFKAQHYKDNILTGAWTSIAHFKKDNPNAQF